MSVGGKVVDMSNGPKMYGRWIRQSWWRCDCLLNWPADKYQCSRCDVRRPMKTDPIEPLKTDSLQSGGFMNEVDRGIGRTIELLPRPNQESNRE